MGVLANELTVDPIGRGYAGMTDEQATDDLNDPIYEGPPDADTLLQYLTLERFRGGTLYGRLQLVAGARPIRAGQVYAIAPLPLETGDADLTPTQDQIAAAQSLLRYVDTDSTAAVSLLDNRITAILDDLAGPGSCQAIGPADKTAIQALSQNRVSRAQQIGISRKVKVGQVTAARAE